MFVSYIFKKEETIHDYGPASNFQGFDFLTSYVYLLCMEEEEEEEEELAKKCDSEFTSFVLYIFLQEDRDIFISLCGQESSIIEQCLDTKCKVHRNPLVFS